MIAPKILTRLGSEFHAAAANMSKENVVRINTAAVIFALTAAGGVLVDRAVTATKLGNIEKQLTVIQAYTSRLDKIEVRVDTMQRDVDRVVNLVGRP